MTATEVLSKGDRLVERGARFLEDLARDFSADGGAKRKLAGELAEDAAFLRKLKPSLIAARARGGVVVREAPEPAPPAPSPLPPPRRGARSGGLNPFVVVGAAFVAGIVLAKVLDWRGHAHPRG